MVMRPPLRYYGGKAQIAAWIISYFPPHRTYTEVFGGAASVLMCKPKAYCEVYNDVDGEIVNLFRVLRDPGMAKDLSNMLRLTPFARDEFAAAYDPCHEPVERARRLVIRATMGHASIGGSRDSTTGFRRDGRTRGTNPVKDFRHYPNHIARFTERLRDVIIENRDYADILTAFDAADSLHYIDPPYMMSTRSYRTNCGYRYEMTDDDHRDLAKVLHGLTGMVIISGYPSALYDKELYPSWQRVTTTGHTNSGSKRTECLWINDAAIARMQGQLSFEVDHAKG